MTPTSEVTTGAVRKSGPPFFLSQRERQILTLLAQGYTAVEMATWLFLAPRTVEYYLQSAYAKLGAKNGPHAVALAVAGRVIQFDTVTA
jgi:DNA-binding CsgD family transcriptional regulator